VKRRVIEHHLFLTLMAILALLSVSCNLVSRFAGQAQETAEAAVETVQVVAQEATATPTVRPADPPTATPEAESSRPEPTATSAPVAEGGVEEPPVAEGSSGTVEVASLEGLRSYRADWKTRMQWPNQERMVMQYRLEWTADPPAQHVWVDMGASPFGEAVWIEGKVWVKAGENWIVGGGEDVEQAFEDFARAFETDDDMTLMGEETVNGVHSKHYLYDLADNGQGIEMHREIWVADQADLPQVPVRAHLWMEAKSTEGSLVTEIEANLYDINTPIEITPPE
jgi:hypothetical protein